MVKSADTPDNRARAQTHAFQAPQTGAVCRHLERSSLGFRVSGLCFVVVHACGADAAGSSPIEPSNALEASSEGRPFAGSIAGISSGRHHKAQSSSGRALTQHMGECRRRTHQSDGAFSAPAPVGLITGTNANRQRKTMHVWSPIEDACKSNVVAQRAVALAMYSSARGGRMAHGMPRGWLS